MGALHCALRRVFLHRDELKMLFLIVCLLVSRCYAQLTSCRHWACTTQEHLGPDEEANFMPCVACWEWGSVPLRHDLHVLSEGCAHRFSRQASPSLSCLVSFWNGLPTVSCRTVRMIQGTCIFEVCALN